MNVEIGTEVAQFLFWKYTNINFFAVCLLEVLHDQEKGGDDGGEEVGEGGGGQTSVAQ